MARACGRHFGWEVLVRQYPPPARSIRFSHPSPSRGEGQPRVRSSETLTFPYIRPITGRPKWKRPKLTAVESD